MLVILRYVLNTSSALLWAPNVDTWIQTETPARVDSENMERYEEEKTISGNPVGNPSQPSRNQVNRIVNNKTSKSFKDRTEKLEFNTAYTRNKIV